MPTTFDTRQGDYIQHLKNVNSCQQGFNNIDTATCVKDVINHFKIFHVDALKRGMVTVEILHKFNAIQEFANEGCFFGINGNIEAKTDTAIFVDCDIDTLGVTEKTKYVFFKNCRVHDVFIHSETGIFRLYDKVNIENLYIEKGSFIQSLRVTGSQIKRIWGDVRGIVLGNAGSVVILYK